MAEIVPFKGILYNAARVSGGDVVAPPYDIVTPELRDELYRKSPYNIIRIDSGAELPTDTERDDKYARAAHFLEEWLKEGILIKSETSCFYAYEMEYRMPEGLKKTRGFFALVKLEELGNGIYPHEETHSKPKADRLNLTIACRANTSPIFSLYNSPAKTASRVVKRAVASRPYMEAQDSKGTVHRLWPIEGEDDIDAIRADLAGKAIFIADGHHRYETALEYRRMMGKSAGTEPYDYVLMFLANMADEGLTILPTHRVIRHNEEDAVGMLSGHFEIERLAAGEDVIRAMRGRTRTFGLYLDEDEQYLLGYRGEALSGLPPGLRGLDVAVLHELVLKRLLSATEILYEMDVSVAKEKIGKGGYDAAFFLNPTLVEDVERVALSQTRMPPKSTYFYPKVMTGFVINSLKNSV